LSSVFRGSRSQCLFVRRDLHATSVEAEPDAMLGRGGGFILGMILVQAALGFVAGVSGNWWQSM
jgi:hypothetical protein